jgi:hypothetical protein
LNGGKPCQINLYKVSQLKLDFSETEYMKERRLFVHFISARRFMDSLFAAALVKSKFGKKKTVVPCRQSHDLCIRRKETIQKLLVFINLIEAKNDFSLYKHDRFFISLEYVLYLIHSKFLK